MHLFFVVSVLDTLWILNVLHTCCQGNYISHTLTCMAMDKWNYDGEIDYSLLNFTTLLIGTPVCPPGQPPVNCFVDPCQFGTCPAHPDATCVADYCGGCNARFFDEDGNEVTDTCGRCCII